MNFKLIFILVLAYIFKGYIAALLIMGAKIINLLPDVNISFN